MKVFKLLGLGSLSLLLSCGEAPKSSKAAPRPVVGPVQETGVPLLAEGHIQKFSKLPLEGTVESSKKLWSGDHWALNKGLINRRWNSPGQEGFDLVTPTKEELLLLSEVEIAQLSPAEKFDLMNGHYDWPLRNEVAKRANPLAVYWEGIGNGWASASSNHDEPSPKTVLNPDGIPVPFGSDDIKALLSYYYAFADGLPPSRHMGLRCTEGPDSAQGLPECEEDLDAGAFHVALGNLIGLRKESFLADIDRFKEVWNHPIQAYKSEVEETLPPQPGSPKQTKKTLRMRTKISYVDEAVGNSWRPIKGSYRQVTSNRVYSYDLHLNASGEIIAGQWRSSDRPDFIWSMPPVDEFKGEFKSLRKLLK